MGKNLAQLEMKQCCLQTFGSYEL